MTKQEIQDQLQYWQDKRDDIADLIVKYQKELTDAARTVQKFEKLLCIEEMKEKQLSKQ